MDSTKIEQFDALPDDACVSVRTAARILDVSENTVRRNYPYVRVSPKRRGVRVGLIRSVVRGEKVQEVTA